MIIKDCIITKSNATIIQDWVMTDKLITGGINLSTNTQKLNIYSPCYGVVTEILYSPQEKYCIVIQYNAKVCIRYTNVSEVKVKKTQLVKIGDLVGVCANYVHVEYLQKEVDGIRIPVRVLTQTFYKSNPTDLVYGRLNLTTSGISDLTIVNFDVPLPTATNISYEFGDNK